MMIFDLQSEEIIIPEVYCCSWLWMLYSVIVPLIFFQVLLLEKL